MAKTKLHNAQADFSKQASDTQSDAGKGKQPAEEKMKWGGEYSVADLQMACIFRKSYATENRFSTTSFNCSSRCISLPAPEQA
jgi:hypothetical protein